MRPSNHNSPTRQICVGVVSGNMKGRDHLRCLWPKQPDVDPAAKSTRRLIMHLIFQLRVDAGNALPVECEQQQDLRPNRFSAAFPKKDPDFLVSRRGYERMCRRALYQAFRCRVLTPHICTPSSLDRSCQSSCLVSRQASSRTVVEGIRSHCQCCLLLDRKSARCSPTEALQ